MQNDVSQYFIEFWSSPIGWVPMAFPADHDLETIKIIGRAMADDYPPNAIGIKLYDKSKSSAWPIEEIKSPS